MAATVRAAYPPSRIEPFATVLARIGSVKQQVDLPRPGGGFDLVGTGQQRPTARLEAKRRRAATKQRRRSPPAED